jgi:ABC-type multidrug transport system fused ATPase/permease subunit
MEMEQGYNTAAGSSGDKLSGGQKQRICIARAMLKNAPIVILDEATSLADPENEDRIQEALSRLIAGKTVIIVAHRLSSIVDADNIVLLENGSVSDQGRHGELLSRSSLYKKLWDAHVESMDWDIGLVQYPGWLLNKSCKKPRGFQCSAFCCFKREAFPKLQLLGKQP